MTYLGRKANCRSKKFKVTFKDNHKNIINSFDFVKKNMESISGEYKISNKGRYIRFDFFDNF